MAVIRQTRRFSQRNIGVVRADTGSSLVRQSVANLANNLIETSFNDLKKAAVKEGKNVADSAAIEQLRSIDPKTGKPQAFVAPEGFGTAAREAYDQVIQQRFVNTLESDFKLKAAELAVQFENDPDGVENFEEAFSSYIDGFGDSKNIDPSINNMIQTLGSQLLASNKINLTQQRMVRQRADTKSGFNADMLTDIDQYSSMVEMSANDAVVFREKMESYIQNGLDSNLINKEEARAYRRSMAMAEATGLSRQLQLVLSEDKSITPLQIDDIFQAVKLPKKSLEGLPENVTAIIENIRQVGKGSNITFDEIASEIAPDLNAIRGDITAQISEDRYQENLKERTQNEGERLDKEFAVNGLPDIRRDSADAVRAAIANGDMSAAKSAMQGFEKSLATAGKAGVAKGTLEDAMKNLREVYQQAIITELGFLGEDGSATSAEEMNAIKQYFLSDGKEQKGMSDKAKELADKVSDYYDEGIDRDNFFGELARVEQNSANLNRTSATETRKAQNINEIFSGMGNSSNSQHREVQEELYNKNSNPRYWLDEGLVFENEQLRRNIINSNVIPQGAVDTVKLITQGDLSAEDLTKAAQLYASFSEVGTSTGDFRNMWVESGVMDKETIGAIEGMIRFASMSNQGLNSLPAIRADFVEMKNDPKLFNRRRLQVLGTQDLSDKAITERDFILDTLGDDVGELVIRDMVPVVKGFISTNTSKKDLEAVIKDVYKKNYKKTDGIVVDPIFGSDVNSRHSFSVIFPDEKARDFAVRHINEQLAKHTSFQLKNDIGVDLRETTGTTVPRMRTIAPKIPDSELESTRAYLVPLPFSGTKASDVRYMVMKKNKAGGYEPLFSEGMAFGFSTDELRESVNQSLLESGKATPEQIEKRRKQREAGTLFDEGFDLFGVKVTAEDITGDSE